MLKLVFLCVLICIGDLLINGNYIASITKFKNYLNSYFHMKDLGTIKYFLRIEIARNSSSIYLCQRKYTLEIISEIGLTGAKPVSTSIEPNHQLTKSSRPLFDMPDRYRILIGKLIYLTITHPELAYLVHILAQFMQNL